MNKYLRSYLLFLSGLPQDPEANIFIELKQYENQDRPNLKDFLVKTQDLFENDDFLRYPLAIGIDRHLHGMKNFHRIIQDCYSKKEVSLPYAEACFLILELMNEMLYDEYRILQNVLEEILIKLKSKGLNKDLGILIAASLEREYLNPAFLLTIEKFDDDDPLYQKLKLKLKENIVLC